RIELRETQFEGMLRAVEPDHGRIIRDARQSRRDCCLLYALSGRLGLEVLQPAVEAPRAAATLRGDTGCRIGKQQDRDARKFQPSRAEGLEYVQHGLLLSTLGDKH